LCGAFARSAQTLEQPDHQRHRKKQCELVAAEQRGAKIKKKPEIDPQIDPLRADTVRLVYRLALGACRIRHGTDAANK
jgi:hypothetical protein